MNLEQLHQKQIIAIEQSLFTLLSNDTQETRLTSAMRYSTLNGGKRIRPMLTFATGLIFNANHDALLRVGSAIELMHTYSLIHDDLPAMDNDDLRRGKPTCHRKYDEATAILVGDALQCLAFEVLSNPTLQIEHSAKLRIIHMLAIASGINGMVGGQAIDLANTGKQISQDELHKMHGMKTGAIIKASMLAGYFCGTDFNQSTYDQLSNIATKLGLLFQIIDDILDITSSTSTLGKTAQKDLINSKATYVTIMGLDESQKYAKIIYTEIKDSIHDYQNTDFLLYLIDLVFKRNF